MTPVQRTYQPGVLTSYSRSPKQITLRSLPFIFTKVCIVEIEAMASRGNNQVPTSSTSGTSLVSSTARVTGINDTGAARPPLPRDSNLSKMCWKRSISNSHLLAGDRFAQGILQVWCWRLRGADCKCLVIAPMNFRLEMCWFQLEPVSYPCQKIRILNPIVNHQSSGLLPRACRHHNSWFISVHIRKRPPIRSWSNWSWVSRAKEQKKIIRSVSSIGWHRSWDAAIIDHTISATNGSSIRHAPNQARAGRQK